MKLHIHLHDRAVGDARWTGTYSAILPDEKRHSITATVLAKNAYEAGDLLRQIFEEKVAKGRAYIYPRVEFGAQAPKLKPGIAKKAARRAGPEEE